MENDIENNLPTYQPKLGMSRSEPVYLNQYNLEQKKKRNNNNNNNNNNNYESKNNDNNNNEIQRERAISDPLLFKNHNNNNNNNRYSKTILQNIFEFLPTKPPLLTRKTSVPVFYCTICLENHPVASSFTTVTCNFSHTYCRESVKTFAESIINEGGINIRCPGYGECQGIFQDEELKNLCDEETYTKFIRFREVKQNPHYRECPFCNHSTIGNESTPEITCEQCQQKYCYFHSNAHPNIPCHRYTKEQLHTQMKSMALIKTMTRNCPNCGTPTEKNGGCNHMTCQHCQTNWCWLCGRVMGDNHFDDVLNGCPGGQFIEPPTFAWWTICSCLRWPIFSTIIRIPYFLLIIPFGIIVFCICLIGVLTSCVCLPLTLPCYLCSKKDLLPCSDAESLPLMPGLLLSGFIGGVLAFAVELIWLPIPIILSIFQFPLFVCSNDFNEVNLCSYFACIVRGEPNPYWCFPLSFIGSLVTTIFRDDD